MKVQEAYENTLGQMEHVFEMMERAGALATDDQVKPEVRERALALFLRMRTTFKELQALADEILAVRPE